MLTLFEFLSGEVPGGLPLLIAVLLAIHLTLSMLKKSRLISRKTANNRRLFAFLAIIIFYFTLWVVLRPPLPRERIVVLPTVNENHQLLPSQDAFIVPETFNRLSFNNLRNQYLLHRWEWTYETLFPDSVAEYHPWENLARHLDPGMIVQSRRSSNGKLYLSIHFPESGDSLGLSVEKADPETISRALLNVPEISEIFLNKRIVPKFNDLILNVKLDIVNKKHQNLDPDLADSGNPELKTLYAQSLLLQGLKQEVDRERGRYTGFSNVYFDRVKRLIYPLIRSKQDPPMVALLLGKIAIWEERFEEADVFLKKALADDPFNSRIYFFMSTLLPLRLAELGFESRAQVLEKAVELDPGYNDAVHALAREYYLSGTGSQYGTGTTNAIRLMENFLTMQSDDPKILSLLATTYLQTSRPEEALAIYDNLERRFPDDSNLHYNKGIVHFQQQEYKKALDKFLKAISIDENLDAFLYAGLTYRMMGENDSALYYYRERVRRKTGDDDVYAKEAMAGIRIIREEILRKSVSGDSSDAR